ncbi:hypothetical protein [Phytoactinopolyspora halotolerans]|uniref:Alpha/beta hydrolase n=1 Tax=Phytoactinopolyspora halotolerans TaxID=1981512 RepID=A0A6L9S413_9ACTN|nr:hypothetical protein [Phytoactinopolyspora halotolerans]NED99197.1 hypothetical protein [Phytoactinopolyspora halotolerans]
MRPGALVLASGPLDPPDWWVPVVPALRDAGFTATAPVDAADTPPFSVGWLASIAQQLNTSQLEDPLVIVGHGSAGPLLPALARAQRAGGRRIGGYVFVDATLPRPGQASHLDLLEAAAPDEADMAHQRLHAPGGLWPEPEQVAMVADAGGAERPPPRSRDHQFWTETLPPAIDWPDAPCAYVHLGYPAAGCGDTGFWARSARSRGWTVHEGADPADGIRDAVSQLPG